MSVLGLSFNIVLFLNMQGEKLNEAKEEKVIRKPPGFEHVNLGGLTGTFIQMQ